MRSSLVVENTLPAFANALELGVSTLELDVQITEDGCAVVTHDRDPSPAKCVDTAAPFPARSSLRAGDQVRQDPHEVRRARLLRQVTIQSFDWGALMRMREVEPRLPIVALTNGQQFLQSGQPGASPWLGGIDIDRAPDHHRWRAPITLAPPLAPAHWPSLGPAPD